SRRKQLPEDERQQARGHDGQNPQRRLGGRPEEPAEELQQVLEPAGRWGCLGQLERIELDLFVRAKRLPVAGEAVSRGGRDVVPRSRRHGNVGGTPGCEAQGGLACGGICVMLRRWRPATWPATAIRQILPESASVRSSWSAAAPPGGWRRRC